MPSKTVSHQDEIIRSLNDKEFHLILLPTEKCNFRCTYCYETFQLGRMSPVLLNSIKKFLRNRITQSLDLFRIDWFGGEPLLAKDIVLDLSRYAKELCSASNAEFFCSMTTNGYFLDFDTACELSNVGISDYQITLDGESSQHNKTRIKADGSGTYDKIWDNLIKLRNSHLKFSVTLRVHLYPDNLRSIESFLLLLKKEMLSDARFSLFLKPIEQLGGPNNEKIETIPHGQQEKIINHLRNLISSDEAAKIQTEMPSLCYASKANSLLIRSDGSLGKCTVAFEDPNNKVGVILPDGNLDIKQDTFRAWLRGIATHDAATLQCPMNGIKEFAEENKRKHLPIIR